MSEKTALAYAFLSLQGLATGDAFGELFFNLSPEDTTPANLPPGPWRWTDDTHMALSVVEVLEKCGRIDQDTLAATFARRFAEEPFRGYGAGAARLLGLMAMGGNWRELAPRLFGGGSFGNGAAMRAAPIGGYFHDDLQRAAREARLSAAITHAHPEGQAGAMAVAVAAALAAGRPCPAGSAFLREIIPHVPEGMTRTGIEKALGIPGDDLYGAALELGTGERVSAQDTVPFCLWSAAHHLDDFAAALRWTVRGLGDCDTTCAIVGGIVALSAPEIPASLLERREPLPMTREKEDRTWS